MGQRFPSVKNKSKSEQQNQPIFPFHELLVFGYIHCIEQLIKPNIVPSPIIDLCFRYYNAVKSLLLLYEENNILHICETNLNNNNKCNKYIIQPLINDSSKYPQDGAYTLTIGHNIKLPSHIHDQVLKTKGFENTDKYDIIFKTGIYSSVHALILPNNCGISNNIVLNWQTPDNHQYAKVTGNYLVFSDKIGLVSIGGNNDINDLNDISYLSFDIDINDLNAYEWKWKHWNRMRTKRYKPSAVITKEKLFIIGGCHYNSDILTDIYLNTVEMYDINNKVYTELNNINIRRRECGIFYCNYNRNIYIGGGNIGTNYIDIDLISTKQPGNKIEFYDIYKNKWIILKSLTNKCYSFKPVLWTEPNNILYIASQNNNINCIERLDLRQKTSKWDILCDLESIFDVNVKLNLNRAGLIQAIFQNDM